jgi:hypothetical protein
VPSWFEESVLQRGQKILQTTASLLTIPDPGDEGVILPSTSTHTACILTPSGNETRILGAPRFAGQFLLLRHAPTGSGNIELQSTGALSGANKIAGFVQATDSLLLVSLGVTDDSWKLVTHNGISFTP